MHLRKRLTFEYDAHRPRLACSVPFAAPATAGGGVGRWPRLATAMASFRRRAATSHVRSIPYGLCLSSGRLAARRLLPPRSGHPSLPCRSHPLLTVALRPRTPDFDVPSNFSLHEQGPSRPGASSASRRAQRVSADAHWVAEEDFRAAVRTPAESRGKPGTLVEFDCRNPDYVVSRVLGGWQFGSGVAARLAAAHP